MGRGALSRAEGHVRIVSIFFQSLRSSSSGNCLALWTRHSSILIDCGLRRQYECRELLDGHLRQAGCLDGVVVTHAHGDHMAYAALRVLQREAIPVHGDRHVVRRLRELHGVEEWKQRPEMHPLPPDTLAIGDFHVTPFEVPHAPGVRTFGFSIDAHDGRAWRRIVVCTDFHDYSEVLPHFVGAHFIFVEANHDLALLREHPNPASRYHLNNVKTASLLHHAVRRSPSPPRAVMLGHLSEERNRARLAIDEVRRVFGRQQADVPFELSAAPAHRPSHVVEI